MPPICETSSLLAFLDEKRKALSAAGQSPDSNADLKVINDLHSRLVFLKQYAENSYYERIERLYPWYTDHGRKHIAQIERMVSQLLYNYRHNLHPFEIFILGTAIFYHDTGMIESRGGHGEAVKEILQQLSAFMPNDDFKRITTLIAAAHTGSFDKLELLSTHFPLTYYSVQARINARALASLLRFADEVSETVARIDTYLLGIGKVPPEHQLFWEYANCIKYSTPDLGQRALDIDVIIEKETCFKEFTFINKKGVTETRQFLDFFIERIKKMDTERKICCANFRDMALIDTIIISVEIDDGYLGKAFDFSPNKILLCETTDRDNVLSEIRSTLAGILS